MNCFLSLKRSSAYQARQMRRSTRRPWRNLKSRRKKSTGGGTFSRTRWMNFTYKGRKSMNLCRQPEVAASLGYIVVTPQACWLDWLPCLALNSPDASYLCSSSVIRRHIAPPLKWIFSSAFCFRYSVWGKTPELCRESVPSSVCRADSGTDRLVELLVWVSMCKLMFPQALQRTTWRFPRDSSNSLLRSL